MTFFSKYDTNLLSEIGEIEHLWKCAKSFTEKPVYFIGIGYVW